MPDANHDRRPDIIPPDRPVSWGSRPGSPLQSKFCQVYGGNTDGLNHYSMYTNAACIGNHRDYAIEKIKRTQEPATRGDPNACYTKGRASYDDRDYPKALAWYRKAANLGHADAQNRLGQMYEAGHGTPQDYSVALDWYIRSADQENANGQNSIGLLYYKGKGVPQDYEKAFEWFQKAAMKRHPDAWNNLGRLYDNGLGVEQDHHTAFKCYSEASAYDHAGAWTNIGIMYENGKIKNENGMNAPPDFPQAMLCYLWAAGRGYAAAEALLGDMYNYGRGQPKDHSRAKDYYLKAAKKDNVHAQRALGLLHYNLRDHPTAKAWIKKAADQGDAEALVTLGNMYLKGLGVTKDFLKATELFREAANRGDATGADSLQYSRQNKPMLLAMLIMFKI
ncbi:hypothetical protein BGX21_005530 [Mortierella sp. AD011]|nr:hypothetical protein BGX21_005530 [Mortierella sp. AD011]